MNRKTDGFSLVELLVSLAILATLTTVALRATNGLQNQARYQQTSRTLDEIRSAILGPSNLRGPDGSLQVTGFVADTGRLPQFQTSPADPLGDPLNELLSRPASLNDFVYLNPSFDLSVKIGVGWQGPYIRLGAGPSFARDGWGNSFHVFGNGSNVALNSSGATIFQIDSWGADAQPDANHAVPGFFTGDSVGYNADISLPNPNNLAGGFIPTATISGRVSMTAGPDYAISSSTHMLILPLTPTGGITADAPNNTFTSATVSTTSVTVWVCYFGPDGTTVFDKPQQISTGANGQYVLTDPKITAGPRILKAYLVDATVDDATKFRTAALAGAVYATATINVTLTSGSQTVPNLVLPHFNP